MAHQQLATSILAVCLTGCGAVSDPSTVLATYRGGEVTQAEYASWLNHTSKQDRPEDRTALLGMVAFTELVSEQAIANRLDEDPEVRWACGDVERRLLVGRLRKEMGRKTTVSEGEVEAALEDNRGDLVTPPRVRLRNIFKRVPEGAGAEERSAIRDGLESVRMQLHDGADFAEMAETHSDSQTGMGGGLIGWVKPGDLSPSVEQVAFSLEPGQVSEIIEGPLGFTILKCDKVMQSREISEDEARQRITTILRRRRAEAEWSRFRDGLLAAADLKIDTDLLQRDDVDGDEVVARFTGGLVTAGELRLALRADRASSSTDGLAVSVKARKVTDHVFRVLAAERACELGYDRDPAFTNHLRWRTAEILVTAQVSRLVGEQLRPLTEPEIQQYFLSNRGAFVVLPSFELAVISFDLDGGSQAQVYSRAEAVLRGIRNGETSFEAAALTDSAHPSAAAGGHLGWLGTRAVAGFGPRILRTVKRMAPGEVSDLVQQDRTLWILWLLDRREQRPMTFEEAHDRAERELGNQRVKQLQQAIEDRLVREMDLHVS